MQNSYANETYQNENYAGFWVRLAAYLIDMIIVGAGLLIVRLIMLGVMWMFEGTILGGNILFHYTLKDIVLYFFKILYFVLLTYYTGTTCGKKLMNLRVVPENRGEKLSFVNVLYRETIGRFLSGLILWIGYIMIGLDKQKRGFHDVLCDTRVVYEKKIKVYQEMKSQQMQPVPPPVVRQAAPRTPQPGQPMGQPTAHPQSGQPTGQPAVPPQMRAATPQPQVSPQMGYQMVHPEQVQQVQMQRPEAQETVAEKPTTDQTVVQQASNEEQEKDL